MNYEKYWKDKDWCTFFPEEVFGKSIKRCCFHHDVDCGKRGSYNFVWIQQQFYKCLRKQSIDIFTTSSIIFATSIYVLIMSPILIYNKYKYRNMK